MNYVYLVLFFLVDAVVLQPLKILISLLVMFMWKPSVSPRHIYDELLYRPEELEFDRGKLIKEINDYDVTPLMYDGDGFKWLTILLGSMIGINGFLKKRKELLECVDSYFTRVGTVGRYPIDCSAKRYYSSNFSGDMASGLLYWLAKEFKSGEENLSENPSLKAALIKFFNNTTFATKSPHNNKKHLLCFVNAQDEISNYNSTSEDRGFIYRFYGLGPDVVRLLAWFRVGYELTQEKRYLYFYKFLKCIYTPLLFVNTGDYGFFFKKIQAIAWYTCNSNMYCHTALFLLDQDHLIGAAATSIRDRHPFNADILSTWFSYYTEDGQVGSNTKPYPYYYPLIVDAAKKGTKKYEGPMTKYFDLRKLKMVERPTDWCLPSELGHRYLWENNPLDPTSCSDERRQQFPVDRYVATLHMLQKM